MFLSWQSKHVTLRFSSAYMVYVYIQNTVLCTLGAVPGETRGARRGRAGGTGHGALVARVGVPHTRPGRRVARPVPFGFAAFVSDTLIVGICARETARGETYGTFHAVA